MKNGDIIKGNFFFSILLSIFALLFYACHDDVKAKVVHIVAAENMYGDIAQQIGGDNVKVDVILNNPDQDPHLFELTPHISRMTSQADLIIMNGLGYDDWINRLISRVEIKNGKVISIQDLLNRSDGSNPHLWYDLQSVKKLAGYLEQKLSLQDPEHKNSFLHNRDHFLHEIDSIDRRIHKIRVQHPDLSVAATEPVFGLMAKHMGFRVLEESYQWVIMNGGEPTPQQTAQFIQDFKTHKIKILFYNNQVSNGATERLKKMASTYKIPVIGVEEIMPVSLSYQTWINQTLDKIEAVTQSIP
ncbi:metal ABC transporter solute-binding protein, Zn/Mn family [Commensalibacter melissae]|uniref:metal ABC transporter solute-binding protein, Zn/Mn family n=1 Tax=Commensalibacter melissae TaxID=2070537 RepID=UPI0012D8E363|nr:zinc ABC transporter substrate-binding protein [Commensalibacter melissae]MUG78579.1 ABC transporter substrate-binding protein [Commensalibacter melissae]